MPASRKKAKGKARKAAKAQQQEQAAALAANRQGSLHSQLQHPEHLGGLNNTNNRAKKCQHGFGTQSFSGWRICDSFFGPFMDAFNASGRHDDQDLRTALDATYEQYSEVWRDPAKLRWVISCFVANGTRYILEGTGEDGEDEHAICDYAIIAFFMEEYVAVTLKKSKENIDWGNIRRLQMGSVPEEHELVTFYHKRCPCKCLEKIYKEGERAKALREKKKALEAAQSSESEVNTDEQREHNSGLDEETLDTFQMNDGGLDYWNPLDVWGSVGSVQGATAAEISPTPPSLN